MNTSAYLSEVTGSIHRNDGSVLRERVAYWPAGGKIASVKDLKAAIRCSDRAFGGYRAYFITNDGACLCDTCAKDNITNVMDSVATRTNDGWRVVWCGMDGDTENDACDNCNAPIGHQCEDQD